MPSSAERQAAARAVAETVWDRAHRALTVGLVLTVAFTAFEALAVATVLPATVKEIDGLALYGWAFSAFMLANLVGIVAAGGASDARGPAFPFTLGAALFVSGLVIAGGAPTMPVLVAGRVVQGLGAGAIAAVSYAAIASGYDDAVKPRMLALLSSAWVVPGLVGPALAGLVADHVGWRLVFLGLAPPTALAAALAIPPLRRLPHAGGGSSVLAGRRLAHALLLAAGSGCALLALGNATSWRALPVLVVGLALALPALRRLVPPGTLRVAPGQPAAMAVMGLLGLAFFGSEAFVPLALTDVRGRSATVAGLPLTLGTLSWTAGAWIQAREVPRRSRRALIAAGLALLLLGIVGTACVLSDAVPLVVAALAWAVAALGMGIAYTTTALTILESAPSGREGESSAALQLMMTLGTALGTGIGGAVLAAITHGGGSTARGIGAAYAASVLALACALAATRRLSGARPGDGASSEPR
jgi:MFS family permease